MDTCLGKKLTDMDKSGLLRWLYPEGKTQVAIECLQRADESVDVKMAKVCRLGLRSFASEYLERDSAAEQDPASDQEESSEEVLGDVRRDHGEGCQSSCAPDLQVEIAWCEDLCTS